MLTTDLSTFALLIFHQIESSAHAWVDAFLFCTSAMLPLDKHMVLNLEHNVPSTTITPSSLTTLSGFIDYTTVVSSQHTAGKSAHSYQLSSLLFCPGVYNSSLKLHKDFLASGFFITEAKLFNPTTYVPQAVVEMYACGKVLQ